MCSTGGCSSLETGGGPRGCSGERRLGAGGPPDGGGSCDQDARGWGVRDVANGAGGVRERGAELARCLPGSQGPHEQSQGNDGVSGEMRQKLLTNSSAQSNSNDEEMGSKQDMQDWLLSVGIVSPVTKETAGDLYHQQLSRQLADFVRIPLEKAGGMIALVHVYCLFNRARGPVNLTGGSFASMFPLGEI